MMDISYTESLQRPYESMEFLSFRQLHRIFQDQRSHFDVLSVFSGLFQPSQAWKTQIIETP